MSWHLQPDPHRNHILTSLVRADYQRLAPQLECVTLKVGSVLCEPGASMHHAYFPTTAIISLLHTMKDGATAEIAIVGNEGMLGVPLLLGGDSTTSRAVVQSAGYAYRMKAGAFREQWDRSDSLTRLLLLYTQSLVAQMAQTAVCYRHHSVYQQLCRRLLLTLDRLDSNEIISTHEAMANVLGVRREGITQAAGTAQRAGLLSYRRGRILVLDRAGIEAQACECYRLVRDECDRLLAIDLPSCHLPIQHAARPTAALAASA